MFNWKKIIFNATIAANCLLFFLLLFYDRMISPPLLQVFGRAHPLFLHFPIVFFALFIAWAWFAPGKPNLSVQLNRRIGQWLLLFAALSSALTALMGVFLSKEPGYDPDALFLHKYSGAFLSLSGFLWYIFYDGISSRKYLNIVCGIASLFILTVAGHEGAGITHGDNFLLAPVSKEKEKKKVHFDEALVFRDMVKPILDTKCLGCHNSKKAKGDLIMETEALLRKGGKDGALWDTSNVNSSLILQRIHMTEEEKKHMPPKGKPQLDDQELAILYNWILRGADFKVKVTELQPTDTLRAIAGAMFKRGDEEESYEFSAASEKSIQRLNNNYRAVYPLSKESPALAVDLYGASFFNSGQLKDLLEVKNQIVSLNLDKIPATDNDLQTIGQFSNLRDLNLSLSKITGNGLSALEKLGHLRRLTLSNTPVKKIDLQKIVGMKSLKHLYVWNTGLSLADAGELRKKYPDLDIQTGMRTDTLFVKLNPPIVQNEAQIIVDTPIRLKLKHYVPGITIRYTLDGTEPDSIHSPVYNDTTFIKEQALMKAKAFKPGWHSSETSQFRFYRAAFIPDTVFLLTAADSAYRGKGGGTLKDLVKGGLGFGDGKWLAFRKNRMEALLEFPKEEQITNITVSSLVNVGALIFPPKSIAIYGGSSRSGIRLLYQSRPAADTAVQAGYLISYECKINPGWVKYIKVVVEPIGTLPKQFITPANEKGWFFIDELFVN